METDGASIADEEKMKNFKVSLVFLISIKRFSLKIRQNPCHALKIYDHDLQISSHVLKISSHVLKILHVNIEWLSQVC